MKLYKLQYHKPEANWTGKIREIQWYSDNDTCIIAIQPALPIGYYSVEFSCSVNEAREYKICDEVLVQGETFRKVL